MVRAISSDAVAAGEGTFSTCRHPGGGNNLEVVHQCALQRAGLLGLSGSGGGAFTTIYVAFARTGSSAANHRGWVFSYRAPDLAPLSFYRVTCGASPANGGGIWQGGAGLASGTDSSGRTYLFIATGDGNFDLNTGGKNAGDSFLKMGTDLSVVDYFTPSDQACRICLQRGAERDVDFGAGGVPLIPDGLLSNYPFLAVVADKGGSIWVIDRNNPGKYHGSSTGQCPNVVCTGPDANVETLKASTHEFHNSPAYWNGSLYCAASGDKLKFYPLANSHCSAGSPPLCSSQVSTAPGFAYGATPSVSSNGSADGIVWAIESTGKSVSTAPGALYAFATGTLTELYNSSRCQVGGVYQDQPGAGTTFSVPTIANGRVYIGTMGGRTGARAVFTCMARSPGLAMERAKRRSHARAPRYPGVAGFSPSIAIPVNLGMGYYLSPRGFCYAPTPWGYPNSNRGAG
jgi:hypothetical protein